MGRDGICLNIRRARVIKISPRNPPNAKWGTERRSRRYKPMDGYMDIPRDPIGYIRSAVMFSVVPVATMMQTMFYVELRAMC
eukprot:6205285-Pleurochrysis_carterae.AAC.1